LLVRRGLWQGVDAQRRFANPQALAPFVHMFAQQLDLRRFAPNLPLLLIVLAGGHRHLKLQRLPLDFGVAASGNLVEVHHVAADHRVVLIGGGQLQREPLGEEAVQLVG
jgi:hypothetical protein